MLEENKDLVLIVKESGLETIQAKNILENFTSLFEQAKEWEVKARGIVVTDANQVLEMLEARQARLALKEIRVNAEKIRKDLKEKSLREGKAIDGIANVIKALVVPIEEHLERQEKYAENIEIERKAKVEAERALELSKYVEDITLYNFKEMSSEVFESLLGTLKKAFENKQAEERAIEELRVKELKDKEIENIRIRKENEVLKKEKEETDAHIKIENEEREATFKIEKDASEKKLAKEREEAATKLKAETNAKLKLEEDARKKKAEEDSIAKQIADADKQAKLAPEKDKLIAYAESIRTIKAPVELSKAGLEIVKEVEEKLLAISQDIKIKIKNL